MSNSLLETPIEFLKGVGPQRGEILKKELGCFTYADMLTTYPFRYIDRTKFYTIREINADLPYVQLKGFVTEKKLLGDKRVKRLVATFRDTTGTLELIWFQGAKWISENIQLNQEYIIFGKPTAFKNKFNIPHPEMELAAEASKTINASLQAMYNSTEKLKLKSFDSRGISKLQRTLVPLIQGNIPETLSQNVIEKFHLISRADALKNIHFPENPEQLNKAQFRLKFEELFFLQLRLLKLKLLRHKNYKGYVFSIVGDIFNNFYNHLLPFQLTNAQKRVVKEIRADMGSGKQMNRMLQGDVGSGKTLVALLTMLIALDNNFQTCLMAPTEILANQHFKTISDLLKDTSIRVGLLTGSSKTSERKLLHAQLESGELKILIGTHALIEDKVKFFNLGLVVIDEQHRFGVEQRYKLWTKNQQPPHVLVMTATPIPRTLAMTLYGDLDVSVIDELPPGRKTVNTQHRYDSSRLAVFGFMKEQIRQGRQVYVVYPLIKESEKMDYKDLMDGYESIVRAFPQPEYQVSIVHGQMKAKDKDFEMQRFIKKQTQIMVATTVIEVGVDVPNATVMVIESAERFGLSQLHQLRGRVGRGADQSYCILMSSFKLSADSKLRLQTMVKTNDGFEIADTDLRLRGPGDIEGTQQSGVLDLKLSDLAKDGQILQYARNAAQDVLKEDPELNKQENAPIVNQLKNIERNKANWSRIS